MISFQDRSLIRSLRSLQRQRPVHEILGGGFRKSYCSNHPSSPPLPSVLSSRSLWFAWSDRSSFLWWTLSQSSSQRLSDWTRILSFSCLVQLGSNGAVIDSCGCDTLEEKECNDRDPARSTGFPGALWSSWIYSAVSPVQSSAAFDFHSLLVVEGCGNPQQVTVFPRLFWCSSISFQHVLVAF